MKLAMVRDKYTILIGECRTYSTVRKQENGLLEIVQTDITDNFLLQNFIQF